MEQHVENVLNMYTQRLVRRAQLEAEMNACQLPAATRVQFKRMLAQKESNHLRLRRAKMDRFVCITCSTHTHTHSLRLESVSCTTGVPHEYVLWPLLFAAYISAIAHIADLHKINQQQCVDDTQLFVCLSPSNYMPDLNKLTCWINASSLPLTSRSVPLISSQFWLTTEASCIAEW